MVDVSRSSAAFGAFCNQAFEDVYRENLEEARSKGGCQMCVDVGHVPLCAHRGWGGEKPEPKDPNVILPDDQWPWVCTREPDHDGPHVACRMDDHRLFTWDQDACVRSAKTRAVTVTNMLEMADWPLPGKFVRRPRMDLISRPGDITMLPVSGATMNPNGTWKVRILTPWHECHTMVVDCPSEIWESLPNTRFCEHDIRSQSKQDDLEKGVRVIGEMQAFEISHDFYESANEVAETLCELHPIGNDNLRKFLDVVLRVMRLYEETHGMAIG
jgi:hypothetical protein